jgi:hypothetical protein
LGHEDNKAGNPMTIDEAAIYDAVIVGGGIAGLRRSLLQ